MDSPDDRAHTPIGFYEARMAVSLVDAGIGSESIDALLEGMPEAMRVTTKTLIKSLLTERQQNVPSASLKEVEADNRR